jgi:hypothetical protein
MPRWLPQVLKRIRLLAAARQVLFTLKARRELAALQFGLDEEDACDVLANLKAGDSDGRLASAVTGEWMYVFKPALAGAALYVKIILRRDCVVVSFHDDRGDGEEAESK